MSTALSKKQAREKAAGHAPAADLHQGAKTLTEAHTVTAAENGTTFFLSATTEFATTLPKPKLGLKYKFVVAAAPSGADYTVVTNGGDNIIKGGVTELEVNTGNDGPTDQNGDTIAFKGGVAVAGDFVEVEADGTNWYVFGMTAADGGVTITSS